MVGVCHSDGMMHMHIVMKSFELWEGQTGEQFYLIEAEAGKESPATSVELSQPNGVASDFPTAGKKGGAGDCAWKPQHA